MISRFNMPVPLLKPMSWQIERKVSVWSLSHGNDEMDVVAIVR